MLIRRSVRAEQFLSRLIERDEAEYDSLNGLIIADRSPPRAFHEAEWKSAPMQRAPDGSKNASAAPEIRPPDRRPAPLPLASHCPAPRTTTRSAISPTTPPPTFSLSPQSPTTCGETRL